MIFLHSVDFVGYIFNSILESLLSKLTVKNALKITSLLLKVQHQYKKYNLTFNLNLNVKSTA